MIIAIDFDGTVVENAYPKIGKSVGAEEVLKKLVDRGHKLILFTLRNDLTEEMLSYGYPNHLEPGDYLTQALQWFERRNIPLWGVNKNPLYDGVGVSPKPYYDLSIDDRNIGTPLIYTKGEPYVDWKMMSVLLKRKGLI